MERLHMNYGQELAQAEDVDLDDIQRAEDGAAGAGEDAPGGSWTTAEVVLVKERHEVVQPQLADNVPQCPCLEIFTAPVGHGGNPSCGQVIPLAMGGTAPSG